MAPCGVWRVGMESWRRGNAPGEFKRLLRPAGGLEQRCVEVGCDDRPCGLVVDLVRNVAG